MSKSTARQPTEFSPPDLVLGGVFLAFLIFLCFGSSLGFGFLVNSDDMAYIFRNPYLKELDWKNTLDIFTHVHFASYMPLTLLSFSLDFTFWEFDARGYHLTQLILHFANALLILVILKTLKVSRLTAMAAVAVYAVHPVHVESVVWVSERKNLLSAFFILLSLLFYIKYTQKTASNLIPSFLFFVLGLLSKPIAVMLPLVFVLYDLCIARRGWKLLEKGAFFAGSLILAGVEVYSLSSVEGIQQYKGGSFWVAQLFTIKVYWDYLVSLVLPFKLSPYHYYPAETLLRWDFFVAVFFLPLIAVTALRRWKTQPIYTFVVGWFVLWLIPVSNIVPLPTIRQERYLYLPSILLVLMVVLGVFKLFKSSKREPLALLVCGILIAVFGAVSASYSPVFHSNKPFWAHVSKVYPNWYMPHYELGYQYWVGKQTDLAIRSYEYSIRLNGNNALPVNNLGAIYLDRGQTERARIYFEQAVLLDPNFILPFQNLLTLAKLTGQDVSKIPEWSQKIRKLSMRESNPLSLGPIRFK